MRMKRVAAAVFMMYQPVRTEGLDVTLVALVEAVETRLNEADIYLPRLPRRWGS
jgi:hypothetical protein